MHIETIPRANRDEVNGIIIGGTDVQWKLFYENREQGSGYAETEELAVGKANERYQSLMTEFSGFPCYLYRGNRWEIRIYG